jgi:hypothetical protein
MDVFGSGCQPYISLEFGHIRVKSSVRDGRSCEFGETLSLPFYMPAMCMAKTVHIVVKDHDTTDADDTIANTSIRIEDIRGGKWKTSRWICLYGAARGKDHNEVPSQFGCFSFSPFYRA